MSLGVRNAGRHPVRSLLTAGLLASAAFLIVAVESFRRQPSQDFLDENSGSGGFALVAESDVPIYQDLNGGPGRQEILDSLERHYRQQPGNGPETIQERLQQASWILDTLQIVPLRLRPGDDASCLNLYQPRRPRLLGVPTSLVQRGGFHFADTQATDDAERKNPWLLLEKGLPDGAVPVFAEEYTAMWMLKVWLGGTLTVPNERGEPVPLRIVGLFRESIFQSELLMSEENFLRLYPGHQGYNFFLIKTPPPTVTPPHTGGGNDSLPYKMAGNDSAPSEVKRLLETALADRGFDVTPSEQRLAAYLAVENTYLSTFQALGALGLLLGSLGLAVVLLRSVWERRGELALLRALGFRHSALGKLVLAENVFLLLTGLLVGSLAAFVSVAPHLASEGGNVPWLRLTLTLGLVLLAGLLAGSLAMRATLRAPLLPALRKE